jgi:hypothetical protein
VKVALALVLCAAALTACGGETAPAKTAAQGERPLGIAADDQSRCDYKGRADREVRETAGRGSMTQNIRRVYALAGQGEEMRKLLLCREVDSNRDGVKDVVRTYNEKAEPLNELADTDFNGKIDTWVTFAHGRIAKVAVDENGDGQPDETRFYMHGKLSRVQRDTNHDGKPDVWEIYDDGHLQRMGVDLDFDGHVDRWDRDEQAARALAEKDAAEERKAQDAAKPATQGEAPPTGAKN